MKLNAPLSKQSSRAFPRLARAFTLAESLFAMTIVSFVLLAIIGIMPSGLASLKDAERRAAETRICQTLAADFEGRSWASLASLPSRPMYFDERGVASTIDPLDDNNPTLNPVYAAEVMLTFDPVAGHQQTMASNGWLPGETSPSPYLRYLRIAITDHPTDTNSLQQALNGTPQSFVQVYTLVLANLEPDLPMQSQ